MISVPLYLPAEDRAEIDALRRMPIGGMSPEEIPEHFAKIDAIGAKAIHPIECNTDQLFEHLYYLRDMLMHLEEVTINSSMIQQGVAEVEELLLAKMKEPTVQKKRTFSRKTRKPAGPSGKTGNAASQWAIKG